MDGARDVPLVPLVAARARRPRAAARLTRAQRPRRRVDLVDLGLGPVQELPVRRHAIQTIVETVAAAQASSRRVPAEPRDRTHVVVAVAAARRGGRRCRRRDRADRERTAAGPAQGSRRFAARPADAARCSRRRRTACRRARYRRHPRRCSELGHRVLRSVVQLYLGLALYWRPGRRGRSARRAAGRAKRASSPTRPRRSTPTTCSTRTRRVGCRSSSRASSAAPTPVQLRLVRGVRLQQSGRPVSAEREFAAAAAARAHDDPEAQVAAAVGRFDKDRTGGRVLASRAARAALSAARPCASTSACCSVWLGERRRRRASS